MDQTKNNSNLPKQVEYHVRFVFLTLVLDQTNLEFPQVRAYMEHLKQDQQQQQEQQQQQRSEFEPQEHDIDVYEQNPPVLSAFDPRYYQSILILICVIVVSSSLLTHFFPDPLGLRKSHFMEWSNFVIGGRP